MKNTVEKQNPKGLSTSNSGSSINSQNNKSNLDELKVNIDKDTGKQGFLIRMNIENKNLRK